MRKTIFTFLPLSSYQNESEQVRKQDIIFFMKTTFHEWHGGRPSLYFACLPD